MKERIFWTDCEKERLLELVFGMQTNSPEKTLTVLLQQAQEQIPPTRRRKVLAFSQLQWLIDGLKSRYADLKAAARRTGPFSPKIVVKERPPEETLREVSTRLLVVELTARLFAKAERLEQAFRVLDQLASNAHK